MRRTEVLKGGVRTLQREEFQFQVAVIGKEDARKENEGIW